MPAFHDRVNDIKGRSTKKLGRIDIRNRLPKLRNLDGWHTVDYDLSQLPYKIQKHYKEWKRGSQRTNFVRWMLRKKVVTQGQADNIGQIIGNQKPISFRVSTKWNDILRAPESRHFFSCFSGGNTREWIGRSQHLFGERRGQLGWRGVQMLRYLADPEMAIVYIPDKAGHYLWRAYIRLCVDESTGTSGWAMYRAYGNAPIPESLIEDTLDELNPLFKLSTKSEMITARNAVHLKSVRTYNNGVAGHTIWSDHGIEFKEEDHKIHFQGFSLADHRKRNAA